MEGEICLKSKDISTYLFILLLLIIFIIYIYWKKTELLTNIDFTSNLSNKELSDKVINLQNELYNTKISEQKCQVDLALLKQSKSVQKPMTSRYLDKIYNPLVSPERIYEGRDIALSNYQMIGFVYTGNDRYPLYGRYKYPGRTDKYEYYIIDETRNKLKIPFKSRNDNELFDGDTIVIPELGGSYTVKIYEYETLRYNPNIY